MYLQSYFCFPCEKKSSYILIASQTGVIKCCGGLGRWKFLLQLYKDGRKAEELQKWIVSGHIIEGPGWVICYHPGLSKCIALWFYEVLCIKIQKQHRLQPGSEMKASLTWTMNMTTKSLLPVCTQRSSFLVFGKLRKQRYTIIQSSRLVDPKCGWAHIAKCKVCGVRSHRSEEIH